jgi:acetylornithine/succinyldiaminopimelate/putrescine aminotransferase
MAAMKVLGDEGMLNDVNTKEQLFRSLLDHKKIKEIRSFGLWLAVEFDSFETNKRVIDGCIANGVLTDWFLFTPNCLRISPPLMLSEEQIKKACEALLRSIDKS